MSFAELLILAVVTSAAVVIAAVVIVVQEAQVRARQRRQTQVFAPASGLLHEEGGRGLGPNPELLHAVQRLG